MFGIPPKLQCLFCLDEYTGAQQHESCSDTWPRAAEHNLSSVSALVDTFYCRQLAAALQHSVCSFLFRQEYFKQILCVQRGRVDE